MAARPLPIAATTQPRFNLTRCSAGYGPARRFSLLDGFANLHLEPFRSFLTFGARSGQWAAARGKHTPNSAVVPASQATGKQRTAPRCWRTWATSRSGWVAGWSSTPRAESSWGTPRPAPCWRGTTSAGAIVGTVHCVVETNAILQEEDLLQRTDCR